MDRVGGLPVMLYNYPDRMGVNMEPEFFELVKGAKNICGIKESSGDINRLHMLMNDFPHIQVTCGMDDQALEFFAWGAKGWVCAGSNFLPKEHVALYQACVVENDFNKGRKIMAVMMPLMSVLEQGGKFIQSVKHGVTFDGHDAGVVRSPLMGLDDAEKTELEQVITALVRILWRWPCPVGLLARATLVTVSRNTMACRHEYFVSRPLVRNFDGAESEDVSWTRRYFLDAHNS
ncbi:dihydrodipicolinate synthase family protein [Rhodanobacter aciditrophus]